MTSIKELEVLEVEEARLLWIKFVQQKALLSEIYNIEDRGAIFWCEEAFENLDSLTGESRILY